MIASVTGVGEVDEDNSKENPGVYRSGVFALLNRNLIS